MGLSLLVVGAGARNKLEPGLVAVSRHCVGRNDAGASRHIPISMGHCAVGVRSVKNTDNIYTEMGMMILNKERV